MAWRRSISSLSNRSFHVGLCDVRDGTATVYLSMSNEVVMGGVASMFGGSQKFVNRMQEQAQARAISERNVEARTRAVTGARKVVVRTSCSSPYWFLNDRPWPPPKKK